MRTTNYCARGRAKRAAFFLKGVGTTWGTEADKVVPSHNRSLVGGRRDVTLPDYRSNWNPLAGHCRHLADLGATMLQNTISPTTEKF